MSRRNYVYCDYAAGAACRPEAFAAMHDAADRHFANPGAHHPLAYEAKHELEQLHKRAADLLGVDPREIIFTSGGTEADLLALRGVMGMRASGRNELVVSAIEHHAITMEAERLQLEGATVHVAPVGSDGVVDLEALAKLVGSKTALVSVMYANNETGVIQPVEEIAVIAHEAHARFHTDAVQAFGKCKLRPRELGADLLSLAAAKFAGPKGMGLLYNEMTSRLEPMIIGGPQEWGLRAGTENLPGMAGMVTAMEIAEREAERSWPRVEAIRDAMEARLTETLGANIVIHGRESKRLPNISNVTFKEIEGQAMGIELGEQGYCVGLGSACAPGETDPSHVLAAMGVSWEDAQGCVRISFGPDITEEQALRLADLCAANYTALRGLG